MTIHGSDPFATPADQRSPLRQVRGRLPAAVTLWTASHPDRGPAGLTVSSTQIVDGNPGRLLALLDAESELWEAISAASRFTVAPLTTVDRQLADRFAGVLPAPGGLFRDGEWRTTGTDGPLPIHLRTWLECRLDVGRPFGWGVLVEATILKVELGEPAAPLMHFRGRYRGLD